MDPGRIGTGATMGVCRGRKVTLDFLRNVVLESRSAMALKGGETVSKVLKLFGWLSAVEYARKYGLSDARRVYELANRRRVESSVVLGKRVFRDKKPLKPRTPGRKKGRPF